jgi:mRNA interferase RelE/StbE
MRIEVSKSAFKELKKISPKYQKIIIEKLKLLENYPDTPNIKKLTNHYPPYRFRVGDYRVLFDVEDEIIKVLSIKHRKEAY